MPILKMIIVKLLILPCFTMKKDYFVWVLILLLTYVVVAAWLYLTAKSETYGTAVLRQNQGTYLVDVDKSSFVVERLSFNFGRMSDGMTVTYFKAANTSGLQVTKGIVERDKMLFLYRVSKFLQVAGWITLGVVLLFLSMHHFSFKDRLA